MNPDVYSSDLYEYGGFRPLYGENAAELISTDIYEYAATPPIK
jgi:hypothetical protein